MNSKNLVICPVYNEEETLFSFYEALRNYYGQDVLFVDDGSEDKSRGFLLKIKDRSTFVIRHPERSGYGQALISGFKFLKERDYKTAVTIDADLQHNPEHIPSFLSQLTTQEVVLGSRYIRIDKYFDVPRKRLLINRYISRLLNVLFLFNFTDPFCGYRGYRASFLNKANFLEKSYGLALEILLEVIKQKVDFKEIPIEAVYFNHKRKFLDGLDSPRQRLLYYLGVISRKRIQIQNEEEIFSSKPSS